MEASVVSSLGYLVCSPQTLVLAHQVQITAITLVRDINLTREVYRELRIQLILNRAVHTSVSKACRKVSNVPFGTGREAYYGSYKANQRPGPSTSLRELLSKHIRYHCSVAFA